MEEREAALLLCDYDVLAPEGEGRFVKEFRKMVNCYRKRFQQFEETVVQNPEAVHNFLLIGSSCAIAMWYTYEKCEHRDHWDKRNLAAMKFCADHHEKFMDLYRELTGSDFPFHEDCGEQYFVLDMGLRRCVLREEVKAFMETHPTLQQSMMRVFIGMLGKINDSPIWEADSFPFI